MGSLAPRHIVQTAEAGGLRGRFVLRDLQQLAGAVEPAIAATLADLPAGFPADVAEPIVGGLRRRTAVLERYLERDPASD
jgi:serine/threonine-protein kinase HipA